MRGWNGHQIIQRIFKLFDCTVPDVIGLVLQVRIVLERILVAKQPKEITLFRGNRSVKKFFKLIIFLGLASVRTILAGSDSFFDVIFDDFNIPSTSTNPASSLIIF